MRKKTRFIVALILFAVIVLVYSVYNAKHPIRLRCAVDPAQVSEIQILDESIEKRYSIADKISIQQIVSNLDSIHFIRGDRVYGNYSFDTVLKNEKGQSLWECTIDSSNTIIYNGYFYKDNTTSIDYGYIQTLLKNLPEVKSST